MPTRTLFIAALILERPICRGCIASRTVASPAEVDAALSEMQQVLTIHAEQDRCRVCGTVGGVVWAERPQT
jgi:hypothetical protein